MADKDESGAPGAATAAGSAGQGVNIDSTLEDLGDGKAPATIDPGPARGNESAMEILSQEEPPEPTRAARDLEAVYDVPVQLSAVLGRSNMLVSQLLKLGRGAVVELDRKVGEAIDIYVNNRLVARGEVVVVEERLGVTMTEIIKTDRAS
jgi:flagellar motor switch protein FliN/FliY